MDEIITECVICGGHICAGSWPPVCSDDCKFEYALECEFSRWARREAQSGKRRAKRGYKHEVKV